MNSWRTTFLQQTTSVKPRINARHRIRRGALALKALAPSDLDDHDDPAKDTHFTNTVALVRSGPRMVVQYLDTGGRQRSNFAGTFVSHPDSEPALHLSEPPSHSAWNPNSERLRAASPSLHHLVSGIIQTIKHHTRRFQKDLEPTQPPPRIVGTRKLEGILASIMSARGFGPPHPPRHMQDPFEIRIYEGRDNTVTDSAVTANKIFIKLRDTSPIDTATALVSLRPSLVLDDNKRRYSSERLGLSRVSINGDEINCNGDSDIHLQISKINTATIVAESQRFDRDLYADLEVFVRIPETPNT